MKRLFALLIILALSPLSAQSTVRDCEELGEANWTGRRSAATPVTGNRTH